MLMITLPMTFSVTITCLKCGYDCDYYRPITITVPSLYHGNDSMILLYLTPFRFYFSLLYNFLNYFSNLPDTITIRPTRLLENTITITLQV